MKRNIAITIARLIKGKRKPNQYGHYAQVNRLRDDIEDKIERIVEFIKQIVEFIKPGVQFLTKVLFILLTCGALFMGCIYSGALEADYHTKVKCTRECPDYGSGLDFHCANCGHDCM